MDEVMDFLASMPTPQQIIDFKVSDAVNERLHHLLDNNRNRILNPEEQAELDEFLRMDHFLIMLKARTIQRTEVPVP